jgi:riboflavin synthase
MFTGIITDIGEVVERNAGRFKIACTYDIAGIEIGASIAHSGCCLTVVSLDQNKAGKTIYELDVSNETLSCTTLGDWQPGTRMNLERALAIGAELGGHIVTGHVDCVAEVVDRQPDGDGVRFKFQLPDKFARFIAEKGSVALDGTSLTVNEVEGNRFGVCMIPHTLVVTTWGKRQPGDRINLEIDLLARYVARMNDCE